MSKYRKFAFRGMIAGAALALMAIVGTVAGKNTSLYASTLPRDCNSNSVIWCGATSIDELETQYANGSDGRYGDLTQIYSSFGISDAAIKGLASGSTQWAWGQVSANGNVTINGQVIGSGAYSGGRSPTPNSVAIAGTGAYKRPTTDSFASQSTVIDAYIGFEGGKPAWAILTSCGNPVMWSRPHTTITKQVANDSASGWTKDANYPNGGDVQYLLTIKNDGQAEDTNVTVIDKLPANQTYVAGSTMINGAKNLDGVTSNGLAIGTLQPGQVVYIQYDAMVNIPYTACGVTNMNNIARVDSDKSPTGEDNATTHTNVVCETPKVVSCSSLSGPDSIMLNDTATFTANASDASLVASYAFTINGTTVPSTGNTMTVKLNQAGKYTVAAKVTPNAGVTDGGSANCVKTVEVTEKNQPKIVSCTSLSGPDSLMLNDTATFTANVSDASLVGSYAFTINGTTAPSSGNTMTVKLNQAGTYTIAAKISARTGVTDGGSANCVKKVTVKEAPKPIYSCDALTVNPSSILVGEGVTAKAQYTAQNGATFKNASFNFGEGNSVVVTNANDVSAKHTYNTAGDKTVSVTISFTMPDGSTVTATSNACQKKVTVCEQPKVVTSCDALNVSDNEITLGETTSMNVDYTAMNTTATNVTFSVNGKAVQSGMGLSFNFKPAAAGTYNVAVTVKFANGDTKSGNGDCAKTVKVKEQAKPIYSCDLLTLSTHTIKNGDKVTATVNYTAENGATFQKAVVNFGEASVNINSAQNAAFTADYTYKVAKDYNVTATVTFMVNGKAVDVTGACASKVSTVPVVIEMCKLPGKEQYPANDKINCAEVKGVTTLPNTGAGNVIGIFASVTAAGAMLHNVLSRRAFRR